MRQGVRLEDGKYGRRAVVTSTWPVGLVDYLIANQVVELELNDGKGWRGNDLSFLAALPGLQSLRIIDLRISSISPVHFLHDLRELEITTYCKTEIRFSAFPNLERCALEWRPKAKSLFGCTTLKSLFVNRYCGKEFAPFGRLTNLESLAILNAPTRGLGGIEALQRLRSLRLGLLRQLASLGGIEACGALELLQIQTCRKLSSLEPVGSLSRLRELHFDNCGDIDSLKPLARLDNLKAVSFYESTNINDGDLTPLLRQRHLERLSFRNRRHYSHRREALGAE